MRLKGGFCLFFVYQKGKNPVTSVFYGGKQNHSHSPSTTSTPVSCVQTFKSNLREMGRKNGLLPRQFSRFGFRRGHVSLDTNTSLPAPSFCLLICLLDKPERGPPIRPHHFDQSIRFHNLVSAPALGRV
jgi:hypothetical protein